MRWLVRLVTLPAALCRTVSPTRAQPTKACIIGGFCCLLIANEPGYAELIQARLRKPIQPDLFGGRRMIAQCALSPPKVRKTVQ